MIFDNPTLGKLRSQYAEEPDYIVPYIILLDRKNDLIDERLLLETIITSVSPEKQKDWLGRLCSKEEHQYMGAWFEMMLFHWLLPSGDIEVEPEILGNRPDFLVRKAGQEIIVEAKALLVSQSEREQKRWQSAIFSTIKEVKLPYILSVEVANLVSTPDTKKLIQEISHWLCTQPDKQYNFEDRAGNVVVFNSEHHPNLKNVGLLWAGEMQLVNPDALKPALQEKAKGNRAVRKAGYPYVIALFIENFLYSVEEVITSWFGNESVVIDTNTLEVIETKRNLRGLHLYRKQVTHRTVSGTLVFKAKHSENFRGNLLQGWFIQNPYAKVKVDEYIFPVENSFIVVEQDALGYKMAWKHT